jgi:ribonuclease HI
MTEARYRREQVRVLNDIIDRALLAPGPGDSATLVHLLRWQEVAGAADRVRLRAMRMAEHDTSRRAWILAASDALVLALYRHPARRGWLYGWCDAAVVRDGSQRRAGIGSIVVDATGRIIARICARIAECKPFEAEIAAVQAALSAVAAHPGGPQCIRIHTDCDALVSLWLRSRRDPRLQAVHALMRSFRRFELRCVPPRHNRVAHRLARDAVLGDVRAPATRAGGAPFPARGRGPGR